MGGQAAGPTYRNVAALSNDQKVAGRGRDPFNLNCVIALEA